MTDNNNAKPIDKSQLDNAQSDVANEAMEGINRTDINQDNASTPTSKGLDESLLICYMKRKIRRWRWRIR